MIKDLKAFFEAKPNLKQLFLTSDGQAFYEEQYARAHGIDLQREDKDGAVRRVTREILADAEAKLAAVDAPVVPAAAKAKAPAGKKGNAKKADAADAPEPAADVPVPAAPVDEKA